MAQNAMIRELDNVELFELCETIPSTETVPYRLQRVEEMSQKS